jgi:hypothetical protein
LLARDDSATGGRRAAQAVVEEAERQDETLAAEDIG